MTSSAKMPKATHHRSGELVAIRLKAMMGGGNSVAAAAANSDSESEDRD